MTRAGNNLWDGLNPQPASKTQVIQGSIEASNVSGVTEMAAMLKVQRAYEQIADLMSRQDELRSEAVQKLGSLSA
jgi:flagellar basal-body rod protein FlgF